MTEKIVLFPNPKQSGSKPSCADCSFSRPIEGDNRLSCRKRPPEPAHVHPKGGTVWPKVQVHDWCAEHESRVESFEEAIKSIRSH
jgi:hypothetical protein